MLNPKVTRVVTFETSRYLIKALPEISRAFSGDVVTQRSTRSLINGLGFMQKTRGKHLATK